MGAVKVIKSRTTATIHLNACNKSVIHIFKAKVLGIATKAIQFKVPDTCTDELKDRFDELIKHCINLKNVSLCHDWNICNQVSKNQCILHRGVAKKLFKENHNVESFDHKTSDTTFRYERSEHDSELINIKRKRHGELSFQNYYRYRI